MNQILGQAATATDAELMAAVRAGQTAALHAIYDRYFRRAYALALRMLGDAATAEDCVHDVFLKLWQKPQMFDAERGAFVSWFLTSVHNNASNHLRRMGRTQPLDLAVGSEEDGGHYTPEPADRAAGESSVEDQFGRAETQTVVRAALAQLNSQQRTALELAYFGGMSQSEIASHLNEPLGTVKTRIRQGMIKLRASLEAGGWGKDLSWG
ncbi:MAG TPA: sigma-70 family RNA polymerase sigma factor [Chloroflexia bacterium]|nr:sigma-70 family RNA polymerase sigma factor [Chloroflexia bacterium]